MYADEIPPFDVTISFMNEYGQRATLVIYRVEFLNEGSGFSIDNVTTEKACTFVARRIDYITPVDANGKPMDITKEPLQQKRQMALFIFLLITLLILLLL